MSQIGMCVVPHLIPEHLISSVGSISECGTPMSACFFCIFSRGTWAQHLTLCVWWMVSRALVRCDALMVREEVMLTKFRGIHPHWILLVKSLCPKFGGVVMMCLGPTKQISFSYRKVYTKNVFEAETLAQSSVQYMCVCLSLHPLGWAHSLRRFRGPQFGLLFSNLNWNLLARKVRTQPNMKPSLQSCKGGDRQVLAHSSQETSEGVQVAQSTAVVQTYKILQGGSILFQAEVHYSKSTQGKQQGVAYGEDKIGQATALLREELWPSIQSHLI